MRKIVYYPDAVLRKTCENVERVDEQLIKEVNDLKETLVKGGIGAGLAAPQIGIAKRFFGLLNEDDRKTVDVFINPKITNTFGKQKTYVKMVTDDGKEEDFLEGCLSFPVFFGTVKRFLKIEAEWQEIEGDKLVSKKKVLEGFQAIVFQHESDHLDGILFVDYIKADGGKFYKVMGKEMVKWSVDKVVEKENKIPH